MIKSRKTPFKSQTDIERLVQNLNNIFNEIQVDFLYGTYIEAEIATGGTKLAHKLGKEPQGWIVVDKDANASVWRFEASDANYINLKSSATVNVKLYIW
jgi:hypothetical protein